MPNKRTRLGHYNYTTGRENLQLCWKCAKCTGKNGGCSWQKHLIPVEGWNATPVKMNLSGKIVDTFKIISCPEFVQDTDDKCTRFLKGSDQDF